MTQALPAENRPRCPTLAPAVAARAGEERRGLWLGLLGVAIFALTLPMTRLATGTEAAPHMTGAFIALGRAAAAGLLSAAWLIAVRAPWPRPGQWLQLAGTALGVVFGFPLLTSIAMRHVEAVHAAVIVGLLPLATAAVGAVLHRQRPSRAFWAVAALGSLLVIAFALLRHPGTRLALGWADLLLVAAVVLGAWGYGFGGRLASRMPAEQVIGWALVLSLPVTLPASLWFWPSSPMPAAAWGAFGYLSVFSMWLGFFAWYRGLALGGTVRVSQVQLAQPFLSMLFAALALGERLDAITVGFALAVLATVLVGRKMPVRAPGAPSGPPVSPPSGARSPWPETP